MGERKKKHSTVWKDLYHTVIPLAFIFGKSGEMVKSRTVLTEILLSERHAGCRGGSKKFKKLHSCISSVCVLVLDTVCTKKKKRKNKLLNECHRLYGCLVFHVANNEN